MKRNLLAPALLVAMLAAGCLSAPSRPALDSAVGDGSSEAAPVDVPGAETSVDAIAEEGPDATDDGVEDAFADAGADADAADPGEVPATDRDGDGKTDDVDNCPDEFNADQADQDSDGKGDACDPDRDGDGRDNDQDNCPDDVNGSQADLDEDGIGDVCDGDRDGDGYLDEADCGPDDKAVHPGATDECNGKDDDCDGTTDPEGATGCSPLFSDGDGDGYGVDPARCLCAAAAPWTAAQAGDCDDTTKAVNPAAAEQCDNAVDDDCDGDENEEGANGSAKYFEDVDRDGYGSKNGKYLCFPSGFYTATKSSDCNDGDAAVHPGATEVCSDGVDNNCDDLTDDPSCMACKDYYRDEDGDAYGKGSGASADRQCLAAAQAPYTALTAGDCNDSDTSVHPGAPEVCDGKDDDCNGTTDDLDAGGCTPYYVDKDGDHYGAYGSTPRCQCGPIGSYSAAADGDCQDLDPSVKPGAIEVCNGKDDDCDGSTDPEGAEGCSPWYRDTDADGFGVPASGKCLCHSLGEYRAVVDTDCNDADAAIHPGGSAVCHADADCDGSLADPSEVCDDPDDTLWDGCKKCNLITEFQVNAGWQGNQAGPSVAALEGAGWVAAWASKTDAYGWDVLYRRYGADGLPATQDVGVGIVEGVAGDQGAARVAGAGTGTNGPRFVVAYADGCPGDSDACTKGGADITTSAVRLFSNGYGATPVNVAVSDPAVAGLHFRPDVSAGPDGDVVVLWESSQADTVLGSKSAGVTGRRFVVDKTKGTLVEKDRFTVNDVAAGWQGVPAVALGGKGAGKRFLAAWTSEAIAGGTRVWVRHFDFDTGAATAASSAVDLTDIKPYQNRVAVAQIAGGGPFLVAWRAASGASDAGVIMARRYKSSDGTAIDSKPVELRAISGTDAVYGPRLAPLSTGSVVLAWSQGAGSGTLSDVYASLAFAQGAFVVSFSAHALATGTSGHQLQADVAPSSDGGGFVAVWTSGCNDLACSGLPVTTQDRSGSGIFATRMLQDGTRLFP